MGRLLVLLGIIMSLVGFRATYTESITDVYVYDSQGHLIRHYDNNHEHSKFIHVRKILSQTANDYHKISLHSKISKKDKFKYMYVMKQRGHRIVSKVYSNRCLAVKTVIYTICDRLSENEYQILTNLN